MKQFFTSFLIDELFVLWTFFFVIGVVLVRREVVRLKHQRQAERRMRLLVLALRSGDMRAGVAEPTKPAASFSRQDEAYREAPEFP